MTRTTNGVLALAVAGVAFLAVACGKGAAEQALAAAGTALEQATPDIQKYLPGELKALTDGMASTKAAFEKGDYSAALTSAQGLLPKIQAAVAAAGKKKDELMAAFNSLKGSLPATVQSLTGRLGQLASAKSLPKGLDQATVEAAQANLGTVTQSWTDALAKFESGDIVTAVTQANDVKTKVEELAKVFLPAATK